MYIPIKVKFFSCAAFALLWAVVSTFVALPWIEDMSTVLGAFWAWCIVGGIAIVPGYMSAFLVFAMLFDLEDG